MLVLKKLCKIIIKIKKNKTKGNSIAKAKFLISNTKITRRINLIRISNNISKIKILKIIKISKKIKKRNKIKKIKKILKIKNKNK
jgi:hypothetical protein